MNKQMLITNYRKGEARMRIDRVKLVAKLTEQDMTQKRLAELAGVSRITVNSIKAGRSCSEKMGHKIANALGVDVEEIIE